MVVYEVRVHLREDLADRFAAWMRVRHIPEVVAAGGFAGAEFEQLDATTFRTRYHAVDQARLDQYLADHAPRLREDFLSQFPEGAEATREVWRRIQDWNR